MPIPRFKLTPPARRPVRRLTPAQQTAVQAGRVPLAKLDVSKRIKLRVFLKMAVQRFSEADLGNTAAALAYYALLSLFPLLLFLGNLLPMMGLNYDAMATYLEQVVPPNIMDWLNPMIHNLLAESSSGILSIGAVATLWVASLGINGLKTGFNRAYGVTKTPNFLIQRLISMVMIFALVIALSGVMISFAFGRQFLEWLIPLLGLPDHWLITFNRLRWPVTISALIIVIGIIDYFLPNAKIKFWTILPGATFTILGWLGLAQGFSLYMKYFGSRISSYGTIGTVIALLLWLNFSAMMLLVGAVINALTMQYFTGRVHHSRGKVHDFVKKQAHRRDGEQ